MELSKHAKEIKNEVDKLIYENELAWEALDLILNANISKDEQRTIIGDLLNRLI